MKSFIAIICLTFTMHSFAQNVGIGNTNPLMKLHISKDDSALLLLENTQALNTDVSNALYFKDGNSGLYPFTGAVKSIGQTNTTARLGFFTYASYNANSLKERLSITDGGQVGIGTTTPASELTIVAPTNTSGFELTDGNKRLQAYVNGFGANIGVDQGIFGLATAGSLRLLVDSLGNVGIGTNSYSTAHLHVTRGINANNGTVQFDGTINASHFNYGPGEETYIRGGKANSQVIINDVSNGNIRLAEGGGFVGIGTSSPTYPLDVNGATRITGKSTFGSTVQISGGSPAANKVLTSTDAIGNAVWSTPVNNFTGFRVFMSGSGTSIPYSASATIPFDNSVSFTGTFDDGANINNTTHRYTAPATGVYQFNVTASLVSGTAVGNGYIALYCSGVGAANNLPSFTVNTVAGQALPRALTQSFVTKMFAGDYIDFTVYNSVPGNVIVVDNLGTCFSGSRIY